MNWIWDMSIPIWSNMVRTLLHLPNNEYIKQNRGVSTHDVLECPVIAAVNNECLWNNAFDNQNELKRISMEDETLINAYDPATTDQQLSWCGPLWISSAGTNYKQKYYSRAMCCLPWSYFQVLLRRQQPNWSRY